MVIGQVFLFACLWDKNKNQKGKEKERKNKPEKHITKVRNLLGTKFKEQNESKIHHSLYHNHWLIFEQMTNMTL